MNRKKYSVKVKMIKEIEMIHEQENMKLALKDVKKLIENSTKETLNEIFNTSPEFIYSVKQCR